MTNPGIGENVICFGCCYVFSCFLGCGKRKPETKRIGRETKTS